MNLAYRAKQVILSAGDLGCFALGFLLSLTIRNLSWPTLWQIQKHSVPFGIVFVIWIIVNYINGLYDLERHTNDRHFYRRLAEAAGFSLIFGIAFFYLFPDARIAPKTILLLTVGLGYGLSALWRFGYSVLVNTRTLATTVVMVGYNPETAFLLDVMKRRPEKGYRAAALIDPESQAPADLDVPVHRALDRIADVIRDTSADIVVIAPQIQKNAQAERQLYHLLFTAVEITDLTSFYELLTGRIPPSTFSEGWFLQHLRRTEKPIYDRIRSVIDYVVGSGLLSILALLFPIIAMAIKLTSRGPIFIRQKRLGKNRRPFLLYKFRSMIALSPDGMAEMDEVQFAKKNDPRITQIGKILRRTHLDELPQAINLLKRDVTLIGPRPERPEIVQELESRMSYYPLRHVVRPGLTGWALIHQNYTDDYDTSLQKLQYDLYYIKNRSFVLDVVIVLRTLNVLLRFMGQ